MLLRFAAGGYTGDAHATFPLCYEETARRDSQVLEIALIDH